MAIGVWNCGMSQTQSCRPPLYSTSSARSEPPYVFARLVLQEDTGVVYYYIYKISDTCRYAWVYACAQSGASQDGTGTECQSKSSEITRGFLDLERINMNEISILIFNLNSVWSRGSLICQLLLLCHIRRILAKQVDFSRRQSTSEGACGKTGVYYPIAAKQNTWLLCLVPLSRAVCCGR